MSDQLDTEAVAKLAGVLPGTIRRERLRGAVPEPDGYLGRTPWWHRHTIEKWLATRPQRGQRGPGKKGTAG
jgi:hypothetical protein